MELFRRLGCLLAAVGTLLLVFLFYVPDLLYTNSHMWKILSAGGVQDMVSAEECACTTVQGEMLDAVGVYAARLWTQARWLQGCSEYCRFSIYQQALEQDPQNPLIAFELGNLYAAAGRMEQAHVMWQRSGSARLWAYRAVDAVEGGDHALAEIYIQRAQSLGTSDSVIQLMAGDLWFDLGDMERASNAYTLFIEAADTNQPRLAYALMQRARINMNVRVGGNSSEQDLLAAFTLDPDDAWIQIRLCELYRDNGQLDLALSYCRAAVALTPDSALAHYYLGRVLFIQRNYIAASAEFETAVTLDTSLDSAHYWLERAREQR